MMSQIVEARTKGPNCTTEGGIGRKLLASECIELHLDIKGFPKSLLPNSNSSLQQQQPQQNAPEAQKPGQPLNVTVDAVSGGWVISWKNPAPPAEKPLYYMIEKKEDTQSAEWEPLTDHKIEPEEASYLIKNMGTAKAYVFRVFAHSATSFTPSEHLRYQMPANVKKRAITAGLIGGVLFFIVAIIVSVCTVKICNRRKRRKQEQAYNMVACRLTDVRNGNGATFSQVPLKRLPQSGVPVVNLPVTGP